MIQLPLGSFNAAIVPGAVDVSVAVPQADPLSFPVAVNPWSVVVFTAPAGSGGGPVSVTWDDVESKPTEFPPSAHTHTASQISDSTAAGRAILTASDAASQRNSLGLGDSATRNVGTTAGTVASGDDSRLSDARTPTGAAGGDLGGTYPNPTVTQARGLRETSGPTTLTLGAIADGGVPARIGATFAGMAGVSWNDTTRTWTFDGGAMTASGGLRILQNWNNSATTFCALEIDVPANSVSSSNSALILAKGGGVDLLRLSRFGIMTVVSVVVNGSSGIDLNNSGPLRFGKATAAFRDGLSPAGVITQSEGTNAQGLYIYNTRTNASNGEWLSISWTANAGWSSNICVIQPMANGTGTVRGLAVRHPPVTLATLPTAATAGAGSRSVISDSTVAMSGNFGAVAAGGGANMVPVISDGTDWRIG